MSASAFTAVFGAVSGIGCAAFANGLRKLPPFSQPWKHAVAAGVGAATMLYTTDVEKSLKAEVDGLRAVRAERNAVYMAEVRAKR